MAAHACALAPAATHSWELARASTHSCALAPGPVGVGMGVCSLRTPVWNIVILHFVKVFDLISVFFLKINVKFSYPNHNFMTVDSVFVRFL